MDTIGTHLLCEMSGIEPDRLNNVEAIEGLMVEAAKVAGATVLSHSFHKFSPQGVSGVVVISESHLSIHTWPERGYAALDFYTCGGIDPQVAFDYAADKLQATMRHELTVKRGVNIGADTFLLEIIS